MEQLTHLTGRSIAQAIQEGTYTADEVHRFFADRARTFNQQLNSFVHIFERSSSVEGSSSLAGVPLAIKDNICIHGKEITCASKILAGHKAVYDATVVARLKKAGIYLLGTTNMDEFAFGSSTENSCYGVAKNPWGLAWVSGGSSGGSAAAVAARLVPFALGSDTGGSIRQPSSFCGVVGFKPTYGRVSRYGLIAFGSSLDQIGPITTNFVDSAHLLTIICGRDSYDSTSASVEVPDFSESLRCDVEGLRIGIPQEYFGQEGVVPCVYAALDEVIRFLKSKGARIVPVTLPHTKYAVATYYIVASSEASSNLQRFDGVKYGYRAGTKKAISDNPMINMYKQTRGQALGDEAKRRIFLGTYSLSSGYYDAYYVRALKVRRLIKEDFDKAFHKVDCVLTPTSPSPAFRIGEKASDPLSMYLSDIFTISANLAGLPAVSFPCGTSSEGLPLGAQLLGKAFDEETLLRVGYTYQSGTDHHTKIPPLTA